MSYLYAYLVIGLAILILGGVRWANSPIDADSAGGNLRDWLDRRQKARWRRVVDRIAGWLLVAVITVVAWPVVVYLIVRELRQPKQPPPIDWRREFAVAPGDLIERLTIADIEAREMVVDPLNAAPRVPFGHLHASWRRVVDTLEDGDELWTFAAHWPVALGGFLMLHVGYVAVRAGVPGAYVVTIRRMLPRV